MYNRCIFCWSSKLKKIIKNEPEASRQESNHLLNKIIDSIKVQLSSSGDFSLCGDFCRFRTEGISIGVNEMDFVCYYDEVAIAQIYAIKSCSDYKVKRLTLFPVDLEHAALFQGSFVKHFIYSFGNDFELFITKHALPLEV